MSLSDRAAQAPRRYAGRSSEERQNERRERLMDTAFELFANQGYQSTPVDRICSEARVTTRHFYQHFRNREALLEALLLRLREEVTGVVLAALEQPNKPMQRALLSLQAFVDYYLGDPRRARIGSVESVGVSTRLEALRRKTTHQFAQFVSIAANDLVAAGILPERDYHLPAIALVGATQELIVEWLTADTGLDAAAIKAEIILLFRSLIRGARRAAQAPGA